MLNLCDPKEFTIEGVRKLIASRDDSVDRQLRVSYKGIAYLSEKTGAEDREECLFRFETWDAGNGWCGPEIAADDRRVERIFNALKVNWPNPICSYLDSY